MRKGLLENSHPFAQLVFTAFAMLTSWLLLSFISMAFAPLLTGVSFADLVIMHKEGTLMQHLGILRYMQIVQELTLFVIPAFFLAYLFGGSFSRYFAMRSTVSRRWLFFVVILMVVLVPLINLLASLNEMIPFPDSFREVEDAAQRATELLLSTTSVNGLLLNLFMIAVLPAVGEELIFRGVVQKIFLRWTGNHHAAIIIAGFLFSAMHLQAYGLFPRWLLGVMFGYMLLWSGSIWLPIVAHFVNNAMAVVVGYLIQTDVIAKDVETYGSTLDSLPMAIFFTGVGILILWKMQRESSLRKPVAVEPAPVAEKDEV